MRSSSSYKSENTIGTEDIQTWRQQTYFNENEKELITDFLQEFKDRKYNAKLEDWTKAVPGEEKLDNGSNAPEMFHNNQYEQLKKYAQHDAHLTAELWRRLKQIKENNWVVIN